MIKGRAVAVTNTHRHISVEAASQGLEEMTWREEGAVEKLKLGSDPESILSVLIKPHTLGY